MMRSYSICIGLGASLGPTLGTTSQYHSKINKSDPCILAGLVVYHRFPEPKKLQTIFDKFRQPEFYETCKRSQNESKNYQRIIEEGPGSKKLFINEWKLYFDNFSKNRN